LKDGTAIFDYYGRNFTLIEFKSASQETGSMLLVEAAGASSLPLKHVVLTDEDHAAKIWGKRLVLVRPDGHVAWRSNALLDSASARAIIKTVTGHLENPETVFGQHEKEAFEVSGLGAVTTQKEDFALDRMGELQK